MSITFGPASPHLVALDAVVSRIEELERRTRELDALMVDALADAFDIGAVESGGGRTPAGRAGELAYRTIRAEIAAALRQSEPAIDRRLGHAYTLSSLYPGTLDALRDGGISERHATVIADAGAVIGGGDDPDTVLRRGHYEDAVLEHAREETPAKLRPIARRLAEQYAATPLTERHTEAKKRRRVWVEERDDGMADLIAHLPVACAAAIFDGITRTARQAASSEPPVGGRARDEIRADVLTDLLLSAGRGVEGGAQASGDAGTDSGVYRGVRGQVQVIIPASLLPPGTRPGRSGETGRECVPPEFVPGPHLGDPTAPDPAHLAGYGPLDPDTAATIAGTADAWDVTRVHPATGRVLAVDRYRPSEAQRRLLGARDLGCRFPGCRAPVSRCDLDHTIDAQHGGPTATDNLAHLCRGHHTLKHHTGWRVSQDSEGTLDWASPTGRRYRARPPSTVTFTPVAASSTGDPPVLTRTAAPRKTIERLLAQRRTPDPRDDDGEPPF